MEKDERVVAQAFLVKRGDETANFFVHDRHHRGVSAARGVGDVRVAVNVFLRRLIRRVRRVESEVEVERFVRVLRVDEFHRVRADELGGVTFFVDGLVVAEPVEHAEISVRVIIQLADRRAVGVIEAALLGPILQVGVAEMPFADDSRGVAGFLERLRQEPLAGVETVGGSAGDDHRLKAVAEGITASHERPARGRTHGLHVELRELSAARGQRVNVRRLDVSAAVESDVLPTQVVSNDVDDVWLIIRRAGRINCGNERQPSSQQRQADVF